MSDLPGLPSGKMEPGDGFAMPMMRGFACPVVTPFMGGQEGPREGMGVGWSNVLGHGVRFFVSVHAEGGFAMVAQLDYARYRRLCENLASVGRQALVTGALDEQDDNDPLAALAVAHEAIRKLIPFARVPAASWAARCAAMEENTNPPQDAIDFAEAALVTVAKALLIEEKDETNDQHG